MNAVEYNRALGLPAARVSMLQTIVGAAPDGIIGPATVASVKAAQRKRDMKPDGKLGPRTYEALIVSAPRAPYKIADLRDTYPGRYWIDVSHHQGRIDWERVTLSVDGVIIKATEGRTYVDPRFGANVAGAHEAGLDIELYHMVRPTISGRTVDPRRQLRNLKASMAVAGLHEARAWLDFEQKHTRSIPEGERRSWVLQLLSDARTMGIDCGLYLSRWVADMIGDAIDVPTWWAHYHPHACEPIRDGWPSWDMHQITEDGRVPGIKGDVDINRRAPR
jgi:GH25 family lysozyme M1 (1,4-beta-N-acetylmuramidase)